VRVAGILVLLCVMPANPSPRQTRWSLLWEATRHAHPVWEGSGRFPRREDVPWERLVVPTILPAQTWSEILGRPVAEDRLAGAVLEERGASLLYRGLFQLDPATLTFIKGDVELLRALHDGSEAFAAFAGSLMIRDGHVAVPGGLDAVPLWEDIVGEAVARPERFIPRLLTKDDGSVAALFDAVAHLEAPVQRFALGLNQTGARRRLEQMNALRRAFGAEPRWWHSNLGSYRRSLVDPARVLGSVAVDASGHLARPSGRRFWAAVFGPARSVPKDGEVDAAWLVEAVGRGSPETRRERLTQLTLAQRVFGDAPESSQRDVTAALRGLATCPALVLTLDRMDVRDPALYVAALDAADRLAVVRDRARRLESLSQLQATLALLDRARTWARALDSDAAATLLRSLFAVVATDHGYSGAIARWWEATLLPTLRRATHAADVSMPRELILAHALSGVRFDAGERQAFEWEGLPYRSDPGSEELRHFQEVRWRQGGPSLDDALGRRAPAAWLPSDDTLFSDVLVAIVYGPHLGPADGPALAGSNVAHRHVFGERPWSLPVEIVLPGVPWHFEGSLLALDVGLAGLAPRRVGAAMPSRQPGFDAKGLLPYARAIPLMSPFAVRDEDVTAIAAAIRKGRERARRLATSADVDAAAQDAGLEAWRREGLRWAIFNEPEAREGFFTLEELLGLGSSDPIVPAEWGTCDLALGGSLRLRPPNPRAAVDDAGRSPEELVPARLPDLSLRVADDLARRSLPASLAPALLARLVRDFADEASPLDYGDRAALARYPRDLPDDRVDDFIASLSDEGPLRPVAGIEAPKP
jgi:hypothetical protein